MAKTKKSANFSRTDFLIPEAKKIFIYLQKTLTKALIFDYFNLKSHIRIKTNALGYIISRILSQMTSDQLSTNYVTHKNYYDFLKSEIG